MEERSKEVKNELPLTGEISYPIVKRWLLLYFLGPSKPHARLRVILQGIFGALLIFGIFTSIYLISASEATAIFFMMPLFSFIFSYFILKEPYTFLRFIISIIIVGGVLLVVRPKIIFERSEENSLNINSSDTYSKINSSNDQKFIPTLFDNLSRIGDDQNGDYKEEFLVKDLALGYSSAVLVPISIAVISILTRQLAQTSAETLNIPLLMMWQGIGSIIVGILSIFLFDNSNTNNNQNTYWWADAASLISFNLMGNIFLALSTKFMIPSLINVIRCNEVVLMCLIQIFVSKSENEKVFHLEYGVGICLLLVAGIMICIETKLNNLITDNCSKLKI